MVEPHSAGARRTSGWPISRQRSPRCSMQRPVGARKTWAQQVVALGGFGLVVSEKSLPRVSLNCQCSTSHHSNSRGRFAALELNRALVKLSSTCRFSLPRTSLTWDSGVFPSGGMRIQAVQRSKCKNRQPLTSTRIRGVRHHTLRGSCCEKNEEQRERGSFCTCGLPLTGAVTLRIRVAAAGGTGGTVGTSTFRT